MSAENTELLSRLNLDAGQAKDLAKNAKLCDALREQEGLLAGVQLDKKTANLLLGHLGQSGWMPADARRLVSAYIVSGRLPTAGHVKEAAAWVKENLRAPLDDARLADFEAKSGVGVLLSAEALQAGVRAFVAANRAEIAQNPNHPNLLFKLRQEFRFAAPAELVEAYKALAKDVERVAAPAAPEAGQKPEGGQEPAAEDAREVGRRFKLEKLLARDLAESLNPPEVLRAHRARTGGAVVTRFPPEPNGYLHIGHAKAMRFSFKVAADHGGYTYLRYDDTNPEAESQEYVDMIRENVGWLGYAPRHVTYASDSFERIYAAALELIRRGKAFVCKLSKEENKRLREAREPSPFRDAEPAANLREFQLMTDGAYAAGAAVLRAKIDFRHANPTLRDPTLYRIKYAPHPHVGDRWCVYPLYDFVHSLCDSFEDITHSLCTLEFENRRELYYWSLSELDLFRPFVWEYSRLNVTYNVVSKRKLLRLVQQGVVGGWDDPRLLTLAGLRRRGYPPEAINEFCDQISVTRRGNENVIELSLLELVVRDHLQEHCAHVFAVAEPVEVELLNVHAPRPLAAAGLAAPLALERHVLLERADVRAEDRPDFYGLAPGKVVRLRHGPFIRAESVRAEGGRLTVTARVLEEGEVPEARRVKGVLHWLPRAGTLPATLRLFDRLFLAAEPGQRTGDFLDDVNPASLVVREGAAVPAAWARGLAVGDRFQFERLGFFAVDPLSEPAAGKLVFNRVVGLREKEKARALGA